MYLEELNGLDEPTAAREFLRCCGSTAWTRQMAASRPFAGLESMMRTSDTIWVSLQRPDWLEAFAAHPRIGDATPAPAAANWAAHEQSGVGGAQKEILHRLAEGNRAYEARFGYIFIVCATGRSAAEMLAILEQRLTNGSDRELHIAAEEQRKITRLRLTKLLT